jgi:DNA-binding NtrC family response regulator
MDTSILSPWHIFCSNKNRSDHSSIEGEEETKILIVDDNQGLANILKMMLEEENYEVRLARDGKDGYLAYLLFKPDLVITDIQMPERNGLKLMEIIRMHNPEVKTIYISADLSRFWRLLEEEKTRYRVSFLEKPFSRSDLLRLLSQFFN